MNFLIFTGSAGVMALSLTVFVTILLVASIISAGKNRAEMMAALRVYAAIWCVAMVIPTVGAAVFAERVASIDAIYNNLESGVHDIVEVPVPVPGGNGSFAVAGPRGFTVAVEREGKIIPVTVPDVRYTDNGPTLTSSTTCVPQEERGFIWVNGVVCKVTYDAIIPRPEARIGPI